LPSAERQKVARERLHIQLDFLCPIGYTSRLVNVLRSCNLTPRQVSYDFIRVHYVVEPSIVRSKLLELCETLKRHANLWRELCVETWLEKVIAGKGVLRTGVFIKVHGVPVYIKPGSGNRVYYKVIWHTNIKPQEGISNVPESMTRLCIQGGNIEALSSVCGHIELLVKYYSNSHQ
jgi:hypothetical protein